MKVLCKIQPAIKMKYEMVWLPTGYNALYTLSHSPLIKIATGQRLQTGFLSPDENCFLPWTNHIFMKDNSEIYQFSGLPLA